MVEILGRIKTKTNGVFLRTIKRGKVRNEKRNDRHCLLQSVVRGKVFEKIYLTEEQYGGSKTYQHGNFSTLRLTE